jgi:hypothetical protein
MANCKVDSVGKLHSYYTKKELNRIVTFSAVENLYRPVTIECKDGNKYIYDIMSAEFHSEEYVGNEGLKQHLLEHKSLTR